ncbi:energy transducer TonB [Parvibium lacunae]|uniref:Energy transducer TonB n=1 Tax=Parvibium lacunae TaxID=1888893 RepID=A0A368L742_9BURK|nr:energy transducer TonB [Parvibium lacunae]
MTEKPRPLPAVKAPVNTAMPVAPPPVMTAASSAAPSHFVVAPQPPAPVVLPPVTAPVPPPPAPVAVVSAPQPVVTPARFDADYLKNPAPVYPPMSKRLGEEGRVLLLVQVSAEGVATEVTLKQSSDFPRLDNAALNAVRGWRFVPAKRGNEPIAASVLVPLSFRLDN